MPNPWYNMLVDMLLPPLGVDADHHKGKEVFCFVVLKVRFSRMNRKNEAS